MNFRPLNTSKHGRQLGQQQAHDLRSTGIGQPVVTDSETIVTPNCELPPRHKRTAASLAKLQRALSSCRFNV